MTSVYRKVYQRRRERRAEAEGRAVRLGRWALALGVMVLMVPLVRDGFLYFLDRPVGQALEPLQAVWFRAALLVMVVTAMDTHGSVLRGEARDVLTLMPVQPRAVVWSELEQVARARVPWLLALAVLLAPLGMQWSWLAWGLGLFLLFGVAAMSLVLSALMFLGAIDVAESPAARPWLDLLRGNNPPAQAALIYALVPSTLLGGLVASQAASTLALCTAGEPAGWYWLGLPWVIALGAARPVGQLAERNWFRASVVLSDIRARYASVEGPEEALHVYLEWTVRFLPRGIARWAMLELRYGWRERRGWLSAMALFALGALVAGWSSRPDAPVHAGALAGSAAWLGGGVVVQSAKETPTFLVGWLPARPSDRALSRLWVTLAWAQGPVLAAVFAGWMFHGTAGIVSVLSIAESSALVAATVASMAATSRDWGRVLYLAVAVLGISWTLSTSLGG